MPMPEVLRFARVVIDIRQEERIVAFQRLGVPTAAPCCELPPRRPELAACETGCRDVPLVPDASPGD
jgi:hypothetical protein